MYMSAARCGGARAEESSAQFVLWWCVSCGVGQVCAAGRGSVWVDAVLGGGEREVTGSSASSTPMQAW